MHIHSLIPKQYITSAGDCILLRQRVIDLIEGHAERRRAIPRDFDTLTRVAAMFSSNLRSTYAWFAQRASQVQKG